MRITEEELKAFPPGEELIQIVKDAIGMGETARRQEAQDALAWAFYGHFRKLISYRYDAYQHIGATYEMDDDLQRLYMYVLYGYREDSKNRLNQTELPLRTWLENLEDPVKARSLHSYFMSVANNYLKRDLARNVERGRGNESLVKWTEGGVVEGAETRARSRKARQKQFEDYQIAEREKSDDEDMMALRRHVRECLELMPSEDAELLLAKYWRAPDEDFTQSEYARTKGISEGTVSKRLSRARETLASLLYSACPDLLQRLGWSKRAPSNTQ